MKGKLTVLLLAIWALAATIAMIYYMSGYANYERIYNEVKEKIAFVNVMVEFSPNYRVWVNNTVVVLNSSLFDLTRRLFNIKYIYKEGFGIEITSINDVGEPDTLAGRARWVAYVYEETVGAWHRVFVGCDKVVITKDTTFKWVLERYS